MRTIFASGLIGLSVFILQGGQIPLPKSPDLKNWKLVRSSNKKMDQEFLGYLWNLKSDLSAGLIPTNLEMVTPSHKLANRLLLVVRISVETGTAITPLLNRFIKQVKYQIELSQEIASELASTKSTVLVLALLPAFGVVLSGFIGINSINWLFQNPIGRIALTIGLILNVLGWLWINRIIKKALSN